MLATFTYRAHDYKGNGSTCQRCNYKFNHRTPEKGPNRTTFIHYVVRNG